MPHITIIGIGDELLIGQVIDTNSAYMGRELNLRGMAVARKLCIADDYNEINLALKESLEHSDVVLITGGLGPTKDDITKKALAGFLGKEMVFNESNWEHILAFAKALNFPTTDAHRLQAYMPEGALLLTNKLGTAPAIWIEHEGKIIVSMPGVPYEMKYLMGNEVIPKLQSKFELHPILHRTILTTGIGESSLADRISDIEESLPEHIKLAYLPSLGQVRLRLSGNLQDKEKLEFDIQHIGDLIRERIKDNVFGEGDRAMSEVIGEQLKAKKMTLATAESCTGGFIAHKITEIAGASAYFHGGIVAYDNSVKVKSLGVKKITLVEHGAVSEQTVKEMAKGAVEALGVDVALSISGVAGPGGGTADKPVGTIWIGVATKDKVEAVRIQGGKKRAQNIQYSTNRALGMLWSFLKKMDE